MQDRVAELRTTKAAPEDLPVMERPARTDAIGSSATVETPAPAPVASVSAPEGKVTKAVRDSFMADKTPLVRNKANANLEVKMNYSDGGIMTRRQFVERAYERGIPAPLKKEEIQGKRKPDMSGYYMTEHWWIGDTQATQTEVEYLKHLYANAKQAAPVAPVAESIAPIPTAEDLDLQRRTAEYEAQRAAHNADVAEYNRLVDKGREVLPGLTRIGDLKEAGSMADLRAAGKVTDAEWNTYVADLQRSGKLEVAPDPVKPAAPVGPNVRPDWTVKVVEPELELSQTKILQNRIQAFDKQIADIENVQIKPLEADYKRYDAELKKHRRNSKAYDAAFKNRTGAQNDISLIRRERIEPIEKERNTLLGQVRRLEGDRKYAALTPTTGDNEVYRQAVLNWRANNPDSNEYGSLLQGLAAVLESKGLAQPQPGRGRLWQELTSDFHDPLASLPVNTPVEDIAQALDQRIARFYVSEPLSNIGDVLKGVLPRDLMQQGTIPAKRYAEAIEPQGAVWSAARDTNNAPERANRYADILETLRGPNQNSDRLREVAARYADASVAYESKARAAMETAKQAEAAAHEQKYGMGKVVPAPTNAAEYAQGKVMAKTGLTEAQSLYIAKALFEHAQQTGQTWEVLTLQIPGLPNNSRMTFRSTEQANNFYSLVMGEPFPGMKKYVGGAYNPPATLASRAMQSAKMPTMWEVSIGANKDLARRTEEEIVLLYGEKTPEYLDRLIATARAEPSAQLPGQMGIDDLVNFRAILQRTKENSPEALRNYVNSVRAKAGGRSPFALGAAAAGEVGRGPLGNVVNPASQVKVAFANLRAQMAQPARPVAPATPQQLVGLKKLAREAVHSGDGAREGWGRHACHEAAQLRPGRLHRQAQYP